MANLILKIQNSEFVEHNGIYVNDFSKRKVEGNGWIARIGRNGSIKCEAKRTYSDGEYSMRYNVQRNGYAKLTLKTPQMEKAKTLKKGFVTPKGEGIKNGTLALSGRRIDERFAYFRGESFNKLLDKYSLNGIKRQSPNGEYTVLYSNQNGLEREDCIETDGNETVTSRKVLMHDKKTDTKKIEVKVKVENATFVILKSNKRRYLYTMENDIEVLNLPHK